MPSVTELDKYLGEFNAKWKTTVKINLLGENERRAKARLDASTGAAAYQVYYVDEANTPEYATAGWLYRSPMFCPRTMTSPTSARTLAMSRPSRARSISPRSSSVGGDILMYRKDVLEKLA